MQIFAPRARRRLTLAIGVASLSILVLPAAAPAAPVVSELRVEAGGRALAPGHSFVNDTSGVETDRNCGGSGRSVRVAGPTAIGLLEYGEHIVGDLRPFGASDEFDFGLFVCRVGPFSGTSTTFWVYKVNHREAQVGGDQFTLRRADKVLWFFQNAAQGSNTGDELSIVTPPRARPGQPFTVTAIAYDAGGNRRSVAGARIAGGGVSEISGPDGTAQVSAPANGFLTLRVTRGGDVPSPPATVCINSDLSKCAPRRGERIYGTLRADPIVSTAGSDVIEAFEGNDTVEARDGARDRIRCGSGRDRARVDGADLVANCETVIRP